MVIDRDYVQAGVAALVRPGSRRPVGAHAGSSATRALGAGATIPLRGLSQANWRGQLAGLSAGHWGGGPPRAPGGFVALAACGARHSARSRRRCWRSRMAAFRGVGTRAPGKSCDTRWCTISTRLLGCGAKEGGSPGWVSVAPAVARSEPAACAGALLGGVADGGGGGAVHLSRCLAGQGRRGATTTASPHIFSDAQKSCGVKTVLRFGPLLLCPRHLGTSRPGAPRLVFLECHTSRALCRRRYRRTRRGGRGRIWSAVSTPAPPLSQWLVSASAPGSFALCATWPLRPA